MDLDDEAAADLRAAQSDWKSGNAYAFKPLSEF
jgi:hypothetical protein